VLYSMYLNVNKNKINYVDSFVPTGSGCGNLDEKSYKNVTRRNCFKTYIPSKSFESQSVVRSGLSMCKHVVLRLSHKALETIPRFSFKVVVPPTPSLSCKTKASSICCAASSYR
jgi:hypothetical protein